MLTSSCPGWICYAEKKHPDILPHITTCKSPQQVLGRVLKTKLLVKETSLYHVTLMPCFDKKLESSRQTLRETYTGEGRVIPDVDLVITPTELLKLFQKDGIDFKGLALAPFPAVDSIERRFVSVENINGRDKIVTAANDSSHSGSSGGYLDYVLRATATRLFHLDTFNSFKKLNFQVQRNRDFKIIHLLAGDEVLVKFALIYGFRNIEIILKKLKSGDRIFDFAEVMACPSGCLNGGAQIKPKKRPKAKQMLASIKQLCDSSMSRKTHDFVGLCAKNSFIYDGIFNGNLFSSESQKNFRTQYKAVSSLKKNSFANTAW